MRAGTWLGNVALLIASLAATLGSLELAARIAWRSAAGRATSYVEFDPLLGWRHQPGARVSLPHGDYSINRLGLRDEDRGYRPAVGHGRIAVLGDSFAEGDSVAFEDAISQVLQRRLRDRGCRYEVINAGTVGYSTDQELLFFREEVSRYRPEIVVLLFYYNDVLSNARASVGRTPKPLFSFTGGGGPARQRPAPLASSR